MALDEAERLRARIERLERARMNAVVRSSQYTERDRRRDEQLAALRKQLEALRAT